MPTRNRRLALRVPWGKEVSTMKKRVTTLLATIGLVLAACSAGPGGPSANEPIPMEPMPGSPAAQAEQGNFPSGGGSAPK